MIDINFVFSVSLSIDSYMDKKDALESIATQELAKKNGHKKKMSFIETTTTTDLFVSYITSGHSYCGGLFRLDKDYTETFTTKNGGKYTCTPYYKDDSSLKVQFKSDRNFSCGQVFSIDIDGTRFNDPEAYVNALSLKPTFYYTSPSDDPGGLRKFRIVYVFSQLLDRDGYELATKAVHKQAEVDTIELIKDCCGERFSQYFNGNRNAQVWKTYNILEPSDLQPIITKYQITLEEKPESDGLFDKELLVGMETMNYSRFMHYNSLKYQYFWSSIDFKPWEEYRILEPGKDVIILFRWGDKFKDGEGRRKKLQKYAALRRIARPWITPDELLFNLYVDRERFFDNSDGKLTLDCLKRKVELAFEKSIDELREEFKSVLENCPYKFVINPSIPNKQQAINKAKKEIHWKEIKDNYDLSVSVKENLEILKAKGIKVKKTTLYEFCKENGIETNPELELKRKKILELYDSSLSQRKNLEILKEKGIDVSKGELYRLLNSVVSSDSDSQKDESESNSDGVSYATMLRSNIIVETENPGHYDFESIFGPLVVPEVDFTAPDVSQAPVDSVNVFSWDIKIPDFVF